MEKLPDFVRWILILPAFAVSLFAVSAGNKLVFLALGSTGEISFFSILISDVIAVGAGVSAARYLAPKYKFYTTIVVSVIEVILVVISIYTAVIAGYEGWEFWKLVPIGIASIVCAFWVSFTYDNGDEN